MHSLQRHFDTVLTQKEGRADGGDILATPDAVIIGLSHRTDRKGAESLAVLLSRLGKKAVIERTPAGSTGRSMQRSPLPGIYRKNSG